VKTFASEQPSFEVIKRYPAQGAAAPPMDRRIRAGGSHDGLLADLVMLRHEFGRI
jgi:hypothetical protein